MLCLRSPFAGFFGSVGRQKKFLYKNFGDRMTPLPQLDSLISAWIQMSEVVEVFSDI